MSVTYSSTRGSPSQKSISFSEVVMTGLAHDKGLFVPDVIPQVSAAELESWRSLSYADMSTELLAKYIKDDEVPKAHLRKIIKTACGAFREKDVTPLVKVRSLCASFGGSVRFLTASFLTRAPLVLRLATTTCLSSSTALLLPSSTVGKPTKIRHIISRANVELEINIFC